MAKNIKSNIIYFNVRIWENPKMFEYQYISDRLTLVWCAIQKAL